MYTSRIGREAVLLPAAALALGIAADTQLFAQEPTVLEEITVTGTRIIRRDFSSQSPIVTIEAETFTERTNIGLEAALNQLPQFTVAGTQAQNTPAGTPFPQASAAPGAATLNLRGLGQNRSLILVDGRRAQPINGLLVVDVNTIPSAAIERVEIITGGAAAVYGADAIAGVVNFILKDDFEGLEFSGQYGLTEAGDGGETSISALMGADFSDGRGNVMVGANYAEREVIYGRDHDWVVAGWEDPGTNAGGIGSSNLSQYAAGSAAYCIFTACGQPFGTNAPTIGLDPDADYGIDQNGNIFDPTDPLNPANPYTGPIGGGYPNEFKINPMNDQGQQTLGYIDREHSYLQLPLERYSVFGSGHIELTDQIRAFTDVRFAETFAKASGFVSQAFNVWSPYVPYDPANDDPDSPTFGQTFPRHPVPAALADLLNSRPVPDAPWTYVGGLDYLPNFTTETTSNVYQLIAGIEGDATVNGFDWSWEFFASHGKTTVNARQPEGFPFLPRLQDLFSADLYGQGFDVLNLPGAQPVAVTGTCTSGLPIFNADGSVNDTPSVSQDCADYVVLRMNSITTLNQDVVEANVTGSLANMPAGELQFALGVSHREEEFKFDPDSGYNANQSFPAVIQNIILPVTVNGVTDVNEIYAEMAIPLIADKKFVQSLEIDPGFRYSDYNTVGSEETYKIMGHWAVNDRLRFRGGYQLATRAPNVTELFTPVGGSELQFGAADACAYYPSGTQPWGNRPENPNRFNVQTLCQYLMTREGAPASLYEPGMPSADAYNFNVFGGTFFFPISIGVTEGNPALQSESADTYTAGIVLSFDRVTLAIDWFDIELENAIGVPAHDTIYQQCLDASFNPLIGDAPGSHTGAELFAGNPFCDLIQREYLGGAPFTPGNYGADRKFSAQFINQGGIKSEGVDVQLDWAFDAGSSGLFNVNVVASFLDMYAESPFPGADFIDYTGTQNNSSYDYQTFTTLRYSSGSWGLGLRWQHLPSIDPSPDAAADIIGVDSHNHFDLFANWTVNDRFTLRGGIDNLLDEDPEIVGATPFDNNRGATSSSYDQFGRRFYLGLSVNL